MAIEPSNNGCDTFKIVVGLLGIMFFHAMDMLQHGPLSYSAQLWAASPNTLIGYICGLILGFFECKLILAIPMAFNFLSISMWYGWHSYAASIGIATYSAYVGKCLGAKSTGLVMFFGFFMSPLISSHHTAYLYEDEIAVKMSAVTVFQTVLFCFSCWEYGIIRLPNIIRAYYRLSRSRKFNSSIEAVLDSHFIWISKKMGWEEALQYFKRKQGFLPTYSVSMNELSMDEGMTKLGDLFTRFLGPQVETSDTKVTFKDLKVTERGKHVSSKGSPEFRIATRVKSCKERGIEITEQEVMRREEEYGEEGLRICREKDWVRSTNGVLTTGVTLPQDDCTQILIKNLLHFRNVFNIEDVIDLEERELISVKITISGFFHGANGKRIAFSFMIPGDEEP
ncbi:hypothetical protein CAEBREN_12051 [Caenorhabditis brenneri]|uniref:Uncharacterized protein n=1 Tax=Caenorhabditis brenneri TaxID=135651 RepID=G0MLB0_CAEBE|nr:hypothetical protein CAEBREN_12051 [Caenorhabditis brenneri]